MKKSIDCVASTNGKNTLHVIAWESDQEVRAIVQISHGMIEYIERYEEFAEYLNERGILVIGNDHLGHGHTAKNDDELGYFGAEKSKTVVDDLHEVTKYAKKTYGDQLPYFLFGHSMGSFMARRYCMTYGNELTGAVICGTGYTPGAVLAVGSMVAGITKSSKGEHYRSPMLKKLAFSSYNKKIPDAKTENDWLSRNEANVAKYNKDKYCTFPFTVNGYETLFGVLKYIQKEENYRRIPADLPLFFIAGKEDPVGNYGEGVLKVVSQYKSCGIKDVECKLYENDRHEILNEDNRNDVSQDVYEWMLRHFR